MKKITLLLFLLISTLAFAQELLLDGNFENVDTMNGGQATGLLPTSGTPWNTSQTAATRPGINSNATVAHTGANFMNLPNDFMSFRQVITAVASTEYTVKLWNQFNSPGGQPASTDGIYIQIKDNTGGNGTPFDPVISYYIDPSTIDANWHEFTFNFTAPQANLLFYVFKQARAASGPNNAARMDDFSITPATLSVKNLEQFSFRSYPNPAKDNLNVSAVRSIDKIEIFNLLGQQVVSKALNTNKAQVNVSNLSNGVYVVKAFIGDAIGSYKFIKE